MNNPSRVRLIDLSKSILQLGFKLYRQVKEKGKNHVTGQDKRPERIGQFNRENDEFGGRSLHVQRESGAGEAVSGEDSAGESGARESGAREDQSRVASGTEGRAGEDKTGEKETKRYGMEVEKGRGRDGETWREQTSIKGTADVKTLEEKNVCISPLGLHQLISVLCSIVSSTTKCRSEFLNLLFGLNTRDNEEEDKMCEELNDAWQNYLMSKQEEIDQPKMNTAIKKLMNMPTDVESQFSQDTKISFGLFTNEQIYLDDDMYSLIKCNYFGDILGKEQLLLDSWIEICTGGMMKTLDADLTDVKSLLLSVVYFNSEWNNYMSWKTLSDMKFYVNDEKSVSMTMLNDVNFFDYAYDSKNGTQFLQITYKNPKSYLLLCLNDDIQKLEDKILSSNGTYLTEWQKEMKETRVEVHFPKFDIQNEHDIIPLLRDINPDLDFSIGSKIGLLVDSIKQINEIKVNEKGTEAMSVTHSVCFDGPTKTVVFNANRPFLYFLFNENYLLFMGKLSNPCQ